MAETGISSTIVGQGDNQVLVLLIPVLDPACSPDEYLRKYALEVDKVVRNVLVNLERIMTDIGMKLKLEKTYVSTSLLNYGKDIIYNGSYSSGSLKKMSKTYSNVNDIYPTLRNRLAAISTSARAATMKGFDAIAPYMVSMFESLNTLGRECRFGSTNKSRLKDILAAEGVEWGDDMKLLSLIVPPDAGGFPVVPFPALLYRGHPDTYMTYFIWIKHLAKTFPIAKRFLGYVCILRQSSCIVNEPFTNNPDTWEHELDTFAKCSYTAVKKIRDNSWGRKVEGVAVPHPIEQTQLCILGESACSFSDCKCTPYILCVKHSVAKGTDREFLKRGTFRHYLGSKTTEKRSGAVLKYPKTERALLAAQQLRRVADWMTNPDDLTDTLRSYIESVILSRTDASENFLKLTAGENYATSGFRRFPDVTSKHESRPGMIVNINCHIIISSDKLGVFSLGKENHNILFQGCYLSSFSFVEEMAVHTYERLQLGSATDHSPTLSM
ncbi:unnamed protein product [Bemisia tabaci]|uniref:RdRp catalytic domain-containing protein n=1 Tax=Bemisia tabaci TaxID=7038 RepID=A0A9P0F7U2_BEMTA|nr:unnamed protein product [Bemisia tabaci]